MRHMLTFRERLLRECPHGTGRGFKVGKEESLALIGALSHFMRLELCTTGSKCVHKEQ
jgi:hypothetical protein